jgi:hypothetical protein
MGTTLVPKFLGMGSKHRGRGHLSLLELIYDYLILIQMAPLCARDLYLQGAMVSPGGPELP